MNVLFIGLGSIAQKHIKALLQLHPHCTIYALRSESNASVIKDVINLYNWNELPANVDFAVIANPTFLHAATLKVLLQKKIPVFLEKPIADKLEDLDIIDESITAQNAFVYIACNLRFLPVLQFIKKFFEENEAIVNEVNVYCGSFLPSWRQVIDFRKNYSANTAMGGGVHLDLFHELDYTCWIFGLPQRSYSIKRSVSSLDINAADYAAFIWEYERFTASVILNYYRPVLKRSMEIVFEDDVWNIDIPANKITNGSNEVVFSDEQYTVLNTYTDQMKYFTACIQNNQKPVLNTFNESLKILKLCLL